MGRYSFICDCVWMDGICSQRDLGGGNHKKVSLGSITVGGGFYVGYLGVQSMDFTKPALLSFYWETIGYFIGSIVPFVIGRAILVERLNKEDFIDKIN
jgi:hypothetical protein